MAEVDELAEHDKAANLVDESQRTLLSDLEQVLLIRNNGEKVPVTELVGKTVGLFFRSKGDFDAQLAELYNELLKKGEAFEIVLVSNLLEEEPFKNEFAGMPWLALPLEEVKQRNLKARFHIKDYPSSLMVLGPDGQIVLPDWKAVRLIQKYGIRAYPFTYEILKEFDAEENAKLRATKTLESILVSDRRDFLIEYERGRKKPKIQLPVSNLVGKTVALLFSSRFKINYFESTLRLIQAYDELKERGEAFEVVLIDEEDAENEEFLDTFEYISGRRLPWLYFSREIYGALDELLGAEDDYEDRTKFIVFGADGKLITHDGYFAVSLYGAKAYPFTDTHLASLERELDEIAEKSAKVIKPRWHQFPLALTKVYEFRCLCGLDGRGWCYYCSKEGILVHFTCASGDDPRKRFAVPLHGCKVPCDVCNPFP